jgi:hypothetical protein
VDKAPEGGKFRATAAASIDATAGAWGDGDMLAVTIDGSGEIILATATNCMGIIFVPEGRRNTDAGTAEKAVIGGRKYTVFQQCELVEAETAAGPALAVGDEIWAEAAGDVDVTATPGVGSIWIGQVLADNSGGGSRVYVNVGLKEASAA